MRFRICGCIFNRILLPHIQLYIFYRILDITAYIASSNRGGGTRGPANAWRARVCRVRSTDDSTVLAAQRSLDRTRQSDRALNSLPRGYAKRRAERSRAFCASSSRFLGAALVSSVSTKPRVMSATCSTARSKRARLAPLGWRVPLTFRTYCSAAARISSSVAGGSKLNSWRMFRHIRPG